MEINAMKTHCKRGHKYTSKDIRRGRRACRACARLRKYATRARRVRINAVVNAWLVAHPEAVARYNEKTRLWKKANPDKVNATNRKRKARKLGHTVHYTLQEWQTLKRQLGYRCVGCWKTEAELLLLNRVLVGDHIIPLSSDGFELDCIENIQPLCHSYKKGSTAGCNNKKGAKTKDFLLS
jgi:HNH endonuclease